MIERVQDFKGGSLYIKEVVSIFKDSLFRVSIFKHLLFRVVLLLFKEYETLMNNSIGIQKNDYQFHKCDLNKCTCVFIANLIKVLLVSDENQISNSKIISI